MIKPFQEAISLIEKIEKAGFEAYFVGGSVRDSLLNKAIHDIDIATSATPQEIKNIFHHTIDVGIEHGTVMVIWNGVSYEITTFRTESTYIDHRRPEQVFFVRHLKEDLKRRDFTINAMAMTKDGEVIDYFHGKESLQKKEIKTVGEPIERFQEDALRIMRAFRFMSTLGFEIEENTKNGMQEKAQLLKKIAVERIATEFDKLLAGKHASKALKRMVETDMYLYLPNLDNYKKELQAFSTLSIATLSTKEAWAILLLCMGITHQKEIDEFLRGWKLSVKKIRSIQQLVYWSIQKSPQVDWKDWDLYNATFEVAISVESIHEILASHKKLYAKKLLEKQYQLLPIKGKDELTVNGKDVLNWTNRQAGPWIRELLVQIEQAVVEKKVENEKHLIKEWLVSCHLI